VEKELEFELAVPGAVGLETAFSATYAGTQDLYATLRALSTAPARIVGLERKIAVGSVAELVIVDKDVSWTVDPSQFESKGRNSPFKDKVLPGVVLMTIHAGKVVFKNDAL
jgi:dihydroorotase